MMQLLAEMKMERDFFPVGREIAGIVLDGKFADINTHFLR